MVIVLRGSIKTISEIDDTLERAKQTVNTCTQPSTSSTCRQRTRLQWLQEGLQQCFDIVAIRAGLATKHLAVFHTWRSPSYAPIYALSYRKPKRKHPHLSAVEWCARKHVDAMGQPQVPSWPLQGHRKRLRELRLGKSFSVRLCEKIL